MKKGSINEKKQLKQRRIRFDKLQHQRLIITATTRRRRRRRRRTMKKNDEEELEKESKVLWVRKEGTYRARL